MMTNREQPGTDRDFRFALPKKGRLRDDFDALFTQSGLHFMREAGRLDYGTTTDIQCEIEPLETVLQRAGDALENIRDGLVDMAVVGRDSYEEARASGSKPLNAEIVLTFNGCSRCALWLAAPDGLLLETPRDLEGLRIVTSYPNALRRWLEDNNIERVKIIARDGGIEDYVRLGRADAVCDVVDTGGTLAANGLQKRIKLFDSTAVLVARTGTDMPQEFACKARIIRDRLAAGLASAPATPGPANVPAFAAA